MKYKIIVDLEIDLPDSLTWEEAEHAARKINMLFRMTRDANGIEGVLKTALLEGGAEKRRLDPTAN